MSLFFFRHDGACPSLIYTSAEKADYLAGDTTSDVALRLRRIEAQGDSLGESNAALAARR
ncbi:MAG TPA: hypothetical protein VGX78_14600 [Pirellulales bacterium]|nr:hypothetical protein [Pirellulales bacterium]